MSFGFDIDGQCIGCLSLGCQNCLENAQVCQQCGGEGVQLDNGRCFCGGTLKGFDEEGNCVQCSDNKCEVCGHNRSVCESCVNEYGLEEEGCAPC